MCVSETQVGKRGMTMFLGYIRNKKKGVTVEVFPKRTGQRGRRMSIPDVEPFSLCVGLYESHRE